MTMVDLTVVDAYLEANLDRYVAELSALCAQPSVSAQGEGMAECAALVQQMLAARGFTTQIIETAGHPVVFGEIGGAGAGTVLLYNHYDVQPAEPLELWVSPAFEPTQRDGRLFARGVVDDKGHIVCRLAALDALKAATGSYPCRVKFIIEGEEEVGSVNLPPFVASHTDLLAADACIWEFGGVDHAGAPQLPLGMRGIQYVELSVTTAGIDTHSGLTGTLIENAAWRLVWALNTLKGLDERIRIPGWYDDVLPATEEDLRMLAALPDFVADYQRRFGFDHYLHGITDSLELRRMGVFEPSCTICGLTAGYQGPGSKTVLPATASAKVDFRLVPNQDPVDLMKKLRAHLDAEGFPDVQIADLGGEPPARTDPTHPVVKLAIDTARAVYGVEPSVAPMIGGSGPNHAFIHHLHVPVVMAGVGSPDNHVHAPNENMVLAEFVRGAKHTARIIAGVAGLAERGELPSRG